MPSAPEPDPSVIGGVPRPPFAIPPADPAALLQRRAARFATLAAAASERLGPYLSFLAALSGTMAELARGLPPAPSPAAEVLARARMAAMPPLDREVLAGDPALDATLDALVGLAAEIDMPPEARLALDAVAGAGAEDRRWLLGNILAGTVPPESIAPHLFAAAAVQVHMAGLANTLEARILVPVGPGLCPACGGRPVTSSVISTPAVDNIRYATCGTCATQWNEVRVKCLCCGSTKGISYRSVETPEATVKAEICRECNSWVKILYQSKNPALDPVADDVGSLGLDLLMRDQPFRRGGFNPFLVGY